MVAQLAARSCGDLEVMGSSPTIRWETFGLNPQTRSSRISRIPPKVDPDQPVVYTKKKKNISNMKHEVNEKMCNCCIFFASSNQIVEVEEQPNSGSRRASY